MKVQGERIFPESGVWYQSLKYLMARVGISFFLILFLGFFTLYFIHEIALPNVQFDDGTIQWAILAVCVFFGFFAYGLIGEQKFHNAFHQLKDKGPLDDKEAVLKQFEDLLHFTSTSYFLPGQGRRFRGLVVRKFADYLLSIGREDEEALKVYLKAFLQSPKNSKFRAPLLAILDKGGDLSENDIDLLLVMLKAEDYKDDFISDHLASVFLQRKQYTAKTEPLFLHALSRQREFSPRIIDLVLPSLLESGRTDPAALWFYHHALPYRRAVEKKLKEILALNYCKGHLRGIDPALHEKCKETFLSLDPAGQAELKDMVENSRISGRIKKVNFFSPEDIQELDRWKVRMGLDASLTGRLRGAIAGVGRAFRDAGRGVGLRLVDGLIRFGKTRLLVKFAGIFILVIVGVVAWNYKEWTEQQVVQVEAPVVKPPPKPIAKKIKPQTGNRIYTIQIAAVTSSKQANRMVASLKKKGVKGLYTIQSPKKSGGNWYKVRVGRFEGKNEAQDFAKQLIDKKHIKNYFILSGVKQPAAGKPAKPAKTAKTPKTG